MFALGACYYTGEQSFCIEGERDDATPKGVDHRFAIGMVRSTRCRFDSEPLSLRYRIARWKRFLSMPRALILDSNVDGGIRSLAAEDQVR